MKPVNNYMHSISVARLFSLDQYNKAIACCIWEFSFTFLGLLIGFYCDFGVISIELLYTICGQGNMATIAPYTFFGMLLSCNIGLLVSNKFSVAVSPLLAANAGMLTGMYVFEALYNHMQIVKAHYVILLHIAAMIAFCHLFFCLSQNIKTIKLKFI